MEWGRIALRAQGLNTKEKSIIMYYYCYDKEMIQSANLVTVNMSGCLYRIKVKM